MTRCASLLLSLTVLVGLGCASSTAELPVRTDHVAGTPFQDWQGFRFSQDDGSRGDSQYPRYNEMTQNALQKELEGRGYTRVTEGSPDFRVAYELDFHGQKEPQSGRTSGAEPAARPYSTVRADGSLTVKMLDPDTGEAVWTGQISGIRLSTIESGRDLERYVWRLLAEFPPITR
jgi:hypothetical protein